MNRKFFTFLTLAVFVILAFSVSAQDMMEPAVDVSDQVSLNGIVTIDHIHTNGPAFIVIHADNGEGSFGAVIGHRQLSLGSNFNVDVHIDASMATSTLYAMLHSDDNEVGVYEFGSVEGADRPIAVDGEVVSPPFNVQLLHAHDDFLVDNSLTIADVVVQEDGFVVVHAGDAESFGAVLGVAPVSAGYNGMISVELEGDITDVLWPMLHFDTGEIGEYEFGAVEGADGPIVIDGVVATSPVWTVPHIRVNDQAVIHGDGMMMDDMMAPTLHATSVLSDGPGFLVVHQAVTGDDGSLTFGPVIGVTAVEDGYTHAVDVELDTDGLTPVLYPMLHVDTNTIGEYEFGTVEGADGPATAMGQVVTFPINAAPSIEYSGSLDGTTLTINEAVIDGSGFLVIHADGGEGPGAVLGVAPIVPGLNRNIVVELDGDNMTERLFPMLHYDTGEAGVYEFGTVEGADAPVFVNGNVVTAPMFPDVME